MRLFAGGCAAAALAVLAGFTLELYRFGADYQAAAARLERGVQAMVDDLGLDGFFETSAKEGWQITELTDAIKRSIDWDVLPMVSSSALLDSIKQFLLEEKEQGRVLCTADDLFHGFLRTNPDVDDHDALRDSFETCIGRVESRDLIRRLQPDSLMLSRQHCASVPT